MEIVHGVVVHLDDDAVRTSVLVVNPGESCVEEGGAIGGVDDCQGLVGQQVNVVIDFIEDQHRCPVLTEGRV